MSDGVLLPPTPAGTEVEVRSRSGVGLVVVAERVGLPFRVRPVGSSLVLIVLVLGLAVVVTKDSWAGLDLGIWQLVVDLGFVVGAFLLHRLAAAVQQFVVRERSSRWKVGVVAPDEGRAPRGQWVLLNERLPAGQDPRERLEALVQDVRSGRFDANTRVQGLRTSLRR